MVKLVGLTKHSPKNNRSILFVFKFVGSVFVSVNESIFVPGWTYTNISDYSYGVFTANYNEYINMLSVLFAGFLIAINVSFYVPNT